MQLEDAAGRPSLSCLVSLLSSIIMLQFLPSLLWLGFPQQPARTRTSLRYFCRQLTLSTPSCVITFRDYL